MFRIGLTGGIAAGKSVTTARLAELGAVVIDHDVLAREALAPGSLGLTEVAQRFGDALIRPDGTLDRSALGALVFQDDDALAALEAIVHPAVRRLAAEREATAVAANPQAVVVHDIPLLVETGQQDLFGLIIVVHAPEEVRLARLITERAMTASEARARLAAQADDVERLAVADVVLDSTGPLPERLAKVDALWERLVEEAVAEADRP